MPYLVTPMSIFQSTLPRGERPIADADMSLVKKFQSTLPRGERRLQTFGSRNGKETISIHAPARGATFCELRTYRFFQFQSTLPRGERPEPHRTFCPEQIFQSTLPRGERRNWICCRCNIRYFNPRSREGSDSKIAHIRNIFSGNYVNLVKICK